MRPDGVITNDDQSPKQTKSALENLCKKHRDTKTRPKQRRAKASEEAAAKAPKERQSEEYTEASQNLKLIDKPLCNHFKTYEIGAHKYKNTSSLQ